MKELSEIRTEIDAIDAQIVELYETRMKLTSEVADYKIRTGKQVFDKEREQSKLQRLQSMASSEFTRHGICELFEQIMSMSRKKQYQLLTEHGLVTDLGFEELEQLELKGKKIVFQGVEGAYAHQAMLEFFGDDAENFHVSTWRDAMEAIKNGEADYAVLPFENSSAGIIAENHDLLKEYDFSIVGEHKLKVNHCLLGVAGSQPENIRKVYSHPQALAQCSKLFEEHREWEQVPYANTALAAKKIKEDGDVTQAAIAGRLTSQLYGLEILQEGIQNNRTNETRFIIVTGKKQYLKGAGKITVCLELEHKSGSLYHILSHFIYNNLNMTSIESRPIQGKQWEYQFFIDFDGNLNDPAVMNALRGIRDEALDFRILGNY